ncbi:LuxR C-terminal-related transcriptional regulator [Vibrio brasiliensis]
MDKKGEFSEIEVIVLNHLIAEKSNKEIARILELSDKTISTSKKRILEKYEFTSVIALALIAKL